MVRVVLYVEGGGDRREQQARLREGFTQLLLKMGFKGHLPTIIACGGRQDAFKKFSTHLKANLPGRPILLVDSESPLATSSIHANDPWAHVRLHDNFTSPSGARPDQICYMATSMETWVVADRAALQNKFPDCLDVSRLPSLHDLERQDRKVIFKKLADATGKCKNGGYHKGRSALGIIALLSPDSLRQHLPEFQRFEKILTASLR